MSLSYDLYLSYFNEQSILKLIDDFTHYLANKHKYKVSRNDGNAINSKLALVFITKDYCQADSCINEIKLMHENHHAFMVIMLEEISIDDLGLVAYYIIDKKRFTAYKDIQLFQKLKGICFDSLIKNINDQLLEPGKQSSHSASMPDLSDHKNVSKEKEKSSPVKKFFKKIFSRTNDSASKLNTTVSFIPADPKSSSEIYFRKIITKTPFKLKSNHLRRISLTSDKQKLLICDIDNKSIMCISLNGEYIKSFNLDNLLKGPCAICIDNKKKEIYVSDWAADKIFVLNESFKIVRDLGEMAKVDTAFDLCYDSDSNYLFCSDSNNSVVTVLNAKTGHLINHLNINGAKNMKIFNNCLYILSDSNSEACVLGLNKKTFEEVDTIKLTNLGMVRGMHIDEMNETLYTTGYEKDKNTKSVIWESAALVVYSLKNGTMLNKINLGITGIWDITINETKMIVILEKENPNYIIEFEKI